MVTIRIPALPRGLFTNLLGVAGLVAVVVAIGALTDWRWALLAAGVFAVALHVVAQLNAEPEAGGQEDGAERPRLAAARSA